MLKSEKLDVTKSNNIPDTGLDASVLPNQEQLQQGTSENQSE